MAKTTSRKKAPANPAAQAMGDEQALAADMRSDARSDDGAPAEERIRQRAYELYLERGNEPGDDVNDWLRAEREYHGRS